MFWFDWLSVTTGGNLTVTGVNFYGSTTSTPPTVVTLTGCGGVTCVITGTITTGSLSCTVTGTGAAGVTCGVSVSSSGTTSAAAIGVV